MYGRPRPARPTVSTEATEQGWIRRRRESDHEILDVDEVPANRPDSIELLRDLVDRIGQRGITGSVELLGEKDVLGDLNRVLEQPVDVDDVDPDECLPLLDGLGRDLADVRDELQLQVVRLSATVARAEVRRDIPPFDVEGAVHRDDSLRGRNDRGVTFQRVGLTRQERRVAFDLDQVEPVGGIDHRFEQPGGGYLGMSEAHSMGAHELGVPADVSDQEKGTPRLHARILVLGCKSCRCHLALDPSGARVLACASVRECDPNGTAIAPLSVGSAWCSISARTSAANGPTASPTRISHHR